MTDAARRIRPRNEWDGWAITAIAILLGWQLIASLLDGTGTAAGADRDAGGPHDRRPRRLPRGGRAARHRAARRAARRDPQPVVPSDRRRATLASPPGAV